MLHFGYFLWLYHCNTHSTYDRNTLISIRKRKCWFWSKSTGLIHPDQPDGTGEEKGEIQESYWPRWSLRLADVMCKEMDECTTGTAGPTCSQRPVSTTTSWFTLMGGPGSAPTDHYRGGLHWPCYHPHLVAAVSVNPDVNLEPALKQTYPNLTTTRPNFLIRNCSSINGREWLETIPADLSELWSCHGPDMRNVEACVHFSSLNH